MYVFKRVFNVRHMLNKSVSMQQHFEQFVMKQRRVELKSVGNVVAKEELVESANQFSLEELCRTHYILIYFSKPYRPSDPLEKTLNFLRVFCCRKCAYLLLEKVSFPLLTMTLRINVNKRSYLHI